MTGKTKLSRTSQRTYPDKSKPLKQVGKRTYGNKKTGRRGSR